MSNDILDLERITLNLDKETMTIDSCNDFTIKLIIINNDSLIKRVARASETTRISVKSSIILLFKIRDKQLSTDRDFMFISQRIS